MRRSKLPSATAAAWIFAAPRSGLVVRHLLALVVLLATLIGVATATSAQSILEPPNFVNATALPVPYDEAMASILGRAVGPGTQRRAQGRTALPAASATAPVDDEIVALARALRGDPDLIYEYVYNVIETLPQYGSLKGPLGTLLDGRGTAFDQAELMAVLLQQAGYTPTLMVGSVRLTGAQLAAWLGTDTSFNSLARVIGTGGFPATLNTAGSEVVSADIGWAWVSVPIGGTSYVFDPAGKSYSRAAGIVPALAGMMGYDQATFLNRGLAGATQTPSSITAVNRINVRTDLAGFANGLRNGLRAQYPAAGPTEILGGVTIVPLALNTRLRQASLPNQTPGSTPISYPSGFPDTLRARLSLDVPGGSTVTLNASDIYGRRLSLFFSSAAQPQPILSLEGQVLTSGTPVAPGTPVRITTRITHPYPTDFANDPRAGQAAPSLKVTASPGGAFVIGTGWGQIGRAMIERHRRILQQNTAADPGNPTAEPVLGESLSMLGYTWLAQVARTQQLIDQIGNTSTVYQHAVGIIGMQAPVNGVTGPYVDLPLNTLGIVQRSGRDASAKTPAEDAAAFASANTASVLESGTLEQTQPSQVAVSTVKLLDIWSQSGVIYDVNNNAVPGNNAAYYFSTIRPVLALTYSAGSLAQIDAVVNANRRAIVPSNGAIAVNNWRGIGYFDVAQDGSSIGAIISGALSGGFATVDQPPAAVVDDTTVTASPPATSSVATTAGTSQGNTSGFFRTIGDPLNQVTGDYVYSHDDLVVGAGAFPYGLGFQRSYDSGRSVAAPGPLGLGWTHNFGYTIQPDSDGFEGMAATSPQNGAAAIAATYVLLDILTSTAANAKPLDRMVIGVLATRWMMDSLTGNVLRVTQPGLTESFVRDAAADYSAPTGPVSYGPPIGSAATLTANLDGTFTYVTKNRAVLAFGAASGGQPGQITSWANAAGVQVGFTYSGTNLVEVANNLGRSLQLGYAGDRLTTVSDGTGRSIAYGYDAAGRLVSYQDPTGQVTAFTYDGDSGRLLGIYYPSNPNQAFVTNVYDSLGHVSLQFDGAGNQTQVFIAGRRTELEDATGSRSAWYYTPLGRPYAEVLDFGYNADGTPRLNLTTRHAYDGQARRVQTTQPEGNSVALTYSPDQRQNVIAVTETPKPGSPLPTRTRSFVYEPSWNQVIRATDTRGTATTFAYDGRGNLIQVIADAGAGRLNLTSSSAYDEVGRVVTATDPAGTTTRFVYDATSNLLSSTADWGPGRLNLVTAFAYDAVGNPVSRTEPSGAITTTTWDAARRPLVVTAPAPFDTGSNLVRSITAYDPDGRVVSVTRTNGTGSQVTARTEYTLTGQVLATTDPNGNRTSFAYDGAERLRQVTLPASLSRTTRYAYDGAGRLLQVIDATGTAAETYAYTLNSRRASFTNGRSAATDYTYDGFDRLVQSLYPLGSTGARTSEAFTWDAGDLMLSRTTRAGAVIAYGYDALGRLTSKTPPAPAPAVTYAYDPAGRASVVADTSPAIPVVTPPPPGTTVRYTTSWSYDRLNRLAGTAWDNAPAAAAPNPTGSVTFTHAYNAANQRIGGTTTDTAWWNVPAATPSSVAYAANPADQYTAVGSVSPTWDANGNLTFDGTNTYAYDVENRLLTVSQGGTTVATYAYDAQGRRKRRIAGGFTTLVVTDPAGREVLEYRASDGAVARWFTWGAGPTEILARMEVLNATRRDTYLPDILGSVAATYASDTGARTLRRYRPYGEGAGNNFPFAFTGQRLDGEAGDIYYFRARHYHPGLGRFLQTDPIGYAGGINLYAYVGNDPLNAIDPEGLLAQQFGSATWNLLTPGGRASQQALAEFQQGNYGSAALQFGIGLAEAGVTVATLGTGYVASVASRAASSVGSAVGALRSTVSNTADLTRVGRWMSIQEFNQMSTTGRVIEGGGGRTYVITPSNPTSYTSARPGSVYAEFDVPSSALRPASKPDWSVIPGPNVTTRMFGPPLPEMPPATCIVCIIGE